MIGSIKYHVSFISCSRSGIHPVTNWVCKNTSPLGPVVYVDNISARRDRKLSRFHSRHMCIYLGDQVITLRRRAFNEAKARINKLYLVTSYEDKTLTDKFIDQTPLHSDDPLDSSAVLLLRDPWNLFSSRYHARWVDSNGPFENIFNSPCWKSHARAYLDSSKLESKYSRVVKVLYNSWFQDKDYRLDIAERLGIPKTDIGIEEIPHVGSSFSKKKLNGKAQSLETLERYKKIPPDRVKQLLEDEELMELSSQLFPEETDSFREFADF